MESINFDILQDIHHDDPAVLAVLGAVKHSFMRLVEEKRSAEF